MSASAASRDFALPPLPGLAWAVLLGLPVLVIAGIAFLPLQQNTPVQVPWAIAAAVAAMLLPFIALRRRHVHLTGRELKVAATFYTRKLDVDALDLDKARVVDLAEHTEFAPRLKLNGYGLPGFKAGHFLLRNRARGFCLLIGDGRTLLLPQHDGKYLLLSLEQPQSLLDELRRIAGPAPSR